MRAQIFNASAGSGKTYRLVHKYIRDVVSEPLRYRHILAVTFTNKATEEMKSRILREIDCLASGGESPYTETLTSELGLREEEIRSRARRARSYILHDYSRFTILTIDTFFQRILRSFIQELGLDLNYNIEIESSSILTQSADNLIEQITCDEELRRWLLEFVEERVEEGKRWDIHDGVLLLGRELLSESNRDTLQNALPKSKLKEIVQSITLRAQQSREAYVALGQRAVDIIAKSGYSATDFKGKSNSFAKKFERIAQGDISAPTKTFRDKMESRDGWCAKGAGVESIVGDLHPTLCEICVHYDRDVKLWNTASLVRENYRSFALLSDLYARVQQICDEQNMMLLSETKLILAEFIKDNDAPFIYEKSGGRYDRFMIDEFQDTSLKEWQNFLPLLQNAMSQSEASSVLIVGDIKQSIYRWRGGDWRILHSGAVEQLGEESTEVITLQDNFRSLPLIVEFNNAIIEEVVECENNYLNGRLEQAKESQNISLTKYAELKDMLKDAYLNHAQNPRKKSSVSGYVELSTFEQSPPIEECIKSILDRGFKPCDIMILNRTKDEGVKIANTLLKFKETNDEPRYKFDVMTQEALIIGNSPMSTFIIANMKLALDEQNPIQRAIYNSFLGHENFDQPLRAEDLAMFRLIRLCSLEEVFENIVIYHQLDKFEDDIAYLQAIHEQIVSFTTSRIGDISLFVKWWEEQGCKKSISVEQAESAIEITTIHKAKGLEKKVVIIPYCNWSLNPKASGEVPNIVWVEGDEEAESLGRFPVKFKSAMGESRFSKEYYRELVYSHIDNVNVLYVALTRAVESLHIFIPQRSSKSKSDSSNTKIGEVLLSTLSCRDEKVCLGANLKGEIGESYGGVSYSFGVASPPLSTPQESVGEGLCIMNSYPTARCDLRLRLPSQRYTEEGEISPRHLGILMHKIFEQATTRDDIFNRIETMRLNGYINPSEHKALCEGIRCAFENPTIEEWFTGEWDEVRNENDIIIPHNSQIRRPDRVMIRGSRSVVVDYKFGALNPSSHKRQVGGYMDLLRQMGYEQVEGYIWYVKSDKIVSV